MDATTLARAIDWGDAPTWLATVGAFVAVFFAYRALRLEHRRDVLRDSVEESQQAAAISAWGSERLYYQQGMSGSVSSLGGWRGGMRIRNASDAPIYNVRVSLVHIGEARPRDSIVLPLVPPETIDIEISQFTKWREAFEYVEHGPHEFPERLLKWSDFLVELTFRDANNREWTRFTDGRLEKQ